jgi:hypothetical protein
LAPLPLFAQGAGEVGERGSPAWGLLEAATGSNSFLDRCWVKRPPVDRKHSIIEWLAFDFRAVAILPLELLAQCIRLFADYLLPV